MKKLFLLLVFLFVFLTFPSFSNNEASAACLPTCYNLGQICPSTHPNKTGTCTIPGAPAGYNVGGYCCDNNSSTNDTCTSTSNYSVTYSCKDSCTGEGESEFALASCPGSEKCCAIKNTGAAGSICISNDQCLSGQCAEGKCVPGTAEIVCRRSGSGSETKFLCSTAIGNISTDVAGFSKSILQILMGLSGGILLVMIIINGYKIMTSQGDPEKIKDAREGIIAAIAGILLIIFAVSILQLITVDIIGIPGFRR